MSPLYKNLLIYFFSFALLLGPAYNTYLEYDYKKNPDCETYMSIAKGEFKDQSLVRRYRILVPFAAQAIAYPFETAYAKLWQHRDASDWPLRMGFLIVNMALMAFVGLAIFHCCKAYGISDTGSLLGLLAVLVGGRWGNLFAAIPITDSLYLLVLCGVIYALKKNHYFVLSLCILIGPLAKESFIFVAPFIFFLSSLSKFKQLTLFAIAGSMACTVRYLIDTYVGSSLGESLASDTGHFSYIGDSILRLASVRGLGELATVLGLFSFVLLVGLTGGKAAINSWTQHLDKIVWWFVPVILVHVLLSGEAARMIYLGAAAWSIMIGLIWDRHPLMDKVKELFNSGQ